MKKIFKATPALLVLLLSIFVSITLYSCDDDDAPNNPGIIGTWTCSNHYYGGSDSYTFKKNGNYEWSYSGTADWFDSQKGTYTFNGSILTITNSKGTTWAYVVLGITNSSMIIMDEDGYKYTYYKN